MDSEYLLYKTQSAWQVDMLGSLCLLSEGMLHFMEKEKSDLFQLFQYIKAVPKRMEDIE